MTPHSINLIHENNARTVLLGLLKQIPHPRRPNPHEHLNKIRTRNRKERHTRLTSNRPRQQRLPRTRRPIQQNPRRNPRPQRLKLLRILKKLLDLMKLLNSLINPRHIPKRDLRRISRHPLGLRLPKRHHPRPTTLHLAHQEDPEADEDQEREDIGQKRQPAAAPGPLDVELGMVRSRLEL